MAILQNSASDALIEKIQHDSGLLTINEFRAALEYAKQQRPIDFDTNIKGIKKRYRGSQSGLLKEALKKRYPKTADNMPIDPVNWLRFFAQQDSGVYTEGATRTLELDGEQLADDDERAKYFADLVERLNLDGCMVDVERRINTGAKSAVLVIGARQNVEKTSAKVVIHKYWPSDVFTITHDSAPDDIDSLWFVAIRQSSSSGDMYWVWQRQIFEDESGQIEAMSNWSHRRISIDGKTMTDPVQYEGTRLPIAFMRIENDNEFWPDVDSDVVANVDELNIGRSNRKHIVDMQAHAQWIYAGTMIDTSTLVTGPDVVAKIGAGEQLTTQKAEADFNALHESVKRDLSELGVSHGNSADAYSTEPSTVESGISRQIANAPHDKRIKEVTPDFKQFEEEQLIPIILETIELYDPNAPIGMNLLSAEVKFNPHKVFESDAEKTTRVESLLALGVIDKEDARVMLGLSQSRAEAIEYFKLQSTVATGLTGQATASPFQSLRETTQVNNE